MALPYRQVKDLYDTLRDAGVVSSSLPDWSSEMNRLTGSDLYAAGVNDNFIKRSSVAIDRLLESTGFPKLTGAAGRAVGEAVGAPDAGERIGEGLPRMAVNFAPLAIPGPGWATAAGLGLSGLLSGAQTYTETGSPAAGVLSGATAVAAPGIAGAAERGALSLLGARRVAGPLLDAAGRVSQVDQFFPTGVQNFLSKGAGQAAAAGTFAASGAGQELLAGEPVSSPLTVDNLLNLTLGQVPFALMHLGGRALRGKGPEGPLADELQHAVDVSTKLIDAQNAKAQLLRENPIESLPDVEQTATPEKLAERDALLAQVRGEQAKISTDPTLTDEQKVAQTDALVKQEADILQQHEITTGDSVLGDTIRQDSPREEVKGREIIRTKNGKYRAILVSDDPSNPEELRGKIIGYSTAYETPPTETEQKGQKTFNLPPPQWRTVKTKEEWNSRFAKVADPNQPELPPQDRPATDEERNAHIADLNKVQVEAEAAQTPADLQKSIVRMQGVQQENNLPVTNDAKLRKRSIQLSKKIEDPTNITKAAVKAEAKKTQREIERAAKPLSGDEAATVSALMEGDETNPGYSVVTADKLSHKDPETFEDLPMNNLVTELAAKVVQGPAGREAFDKWDRKGETTLENDQVLFHTLADEFGSIKDVSPDEVAEYLTSIGNMSAADAKSEIEDFLQRPHVKVWERELDAQVTARRDGHAAPYLATPAGRSWLLSIGNYDPISNTLNEKHKLPKSGEVPVSVFRNIAGVGKPLTVAEIDLYKQIVPEAFSVKKVNTAGKNTEGFVMFEPIEHVNVPKLVEGLRNKGPIVETKNLGGDTMEVDEHAAMEQTQHELETRGYDASIHFDEAVVTEKAHDREVVDPDWFDIKDFDPNHHVWMSTLPEQDQQLLRRFYDSANAVIGDDTVRYQGGQYKSIAPKPEKDMPGFVTGLIRLPLGSEGERHGSFNHMDRLVSEGLGEKPRPEAIYHGPHFGSEDKNVIAFYRGYIETLPDGTKAFHVIEVQSDWAQSRRDLKEKLLREDLPSQNEADYTVKSTRIPNNDPNYREGGIKYELIYKPTNEIVHEIAYGPHAQLGPTKTVKSMLEDHANLKVHYSGEGAPEHPLLKVYESLALKAAIQHAKEIGATKIITSDAQTAMMTEGHDRGVDRIPPGPRDALASSDRAAAERMAQTETNVTGIIHNVYNEDPLANNGQGYWRVNSTGERREPPQAKGMRQHYDQSIPSTMEKLTGQKGEPVDLGVHKNAGEGPDRSVATLNQIGAIQDRFSRGEITREQLETEIAAIAPSEKPPGSPVFRDAAGNPKTQITGRMYDISNTPDAFTLTDPHRAPEELYGKPFTPQSSDDKATVEALGNDGHSALKFLEDSDNNVVRALAADLSKFSDSLGRISLSVMKTASGTSAAFYEGGGKSRIAISDGHLGNRQMLDYVVAHELVHGLTMAELDNPAKVGIVKDLESMRSRLIDALPSRLRAAYDRAIATDWYGKYARKETTWQDLAPNATTNEAHIVYSLLSVHEMVAQGLTSGPFRKFMGSIKSPENVSWYSRFTNFVKALVGIGPSVSDTAFGEFLSKTDQLLQNGNYVSSFSDFSDRYFENLGMPKDLVDLNTRKALEVVLQSNSSITPHNIIDKLSYTGQIYNREFTSAHRKVVNMFKFGGSDAEQSTKVLGELGYGMHQAGLDDFSTELLRGSVTPDHLDALDLLPKIAQDYVFAKAKDVQDTLGVLKAATDAKNEGLLNLADPKVLHGPVRVAEKLVNATIQSRNEWQQSEQLVHEMSNIAPDAFAVRDQYDPKLSPPVVEAFMRESTAAKKRGLGWFLEPVAQIARAIPQAREIIDAAFRLEANARQYLGQTLKPLGIDFREGSDQLAKDVVKANIKLLRNPRTYDALNSWIGENNIRANDEGRGVTLLPESDPEIQKILSGLSSQERADVSEFVKNQGVMTQVEHLQALNYMLKIGSSRAGVIVLKDQPNVKSFQAVELVDRLFKALLADKTNPVAMQEADAQMKVVQSKMSVEGFVDLLKYSQAEIENYNNWKQYYEQNPYFNSAQRQEKYLVNFKNKDGWQKLQASSTKEANELFKKYRGIGEPEIVENFKGRNDEFPSLGPDVAKLSQRMKELQDTQTAIMKNKVSPEALDAMIKYSPTTQILREAAGEGGGIPRFATPPRLLSQGAEKLPWFWNHISYMQRRSNYWTRQLLRAKSDLLLNDPDMLSNPDLASQMKQHIENMLQPDPQLSRSVNRFASTWFMGFAPASAMVNGLQTLSTLVPELTNITGKAIHSYGLWKGAVADTLAHYSKGGGKVWKEKEIDDLMRFTEQAGGTGFSMWDEEAQTHEQISTGFKQAMMKDKPQNLAQRLTTAAGVWSTAGMWMFKNVEIFNQRVATIAAYRAYRELGNSIPEAQQLALETNRAVNYGGGRAGRPIGLYSGSDSFTRGAAMLATNMQNYNLGVISQLGRYLQSGFFRPGDLKPAEVFAARKAGIQMLGTQLAAAGLLGLPFASGMVALLNQMFPNLEVNKRLRESVADFFSSDKSNGSILTDAAMTGLPSMLGWDMQSRLSMGNITPGVSEYNGFQPGLLLGPPANLVTNFVNGALKIVQGEPQGAAAFIPPGLKKITQLAFGEGQLKDYKDRPLFTPTLGETAGLALGFNPKRLSDLNAASRMADQTTQVANRREGQFHQEQAAEVLKGNFGNVRQALLARSQADKTYDPTEAVRSIAKAAEDLSFPRDLRREGTQSTDASRNQLLSTFNITPQSPSEVERLKFRRQVEQRLGLRIQDSGQAVLATAMDRLRQQNPDASRVELRRQAELTLRGARQTPSLLPETP